MKPYVIHIVGVRVEYRVKLMYTVVILYIVPMYYIFTSAAICYILKSMVLNKVICAHYD